MKHFLLTIFVLVLSVGTAHAEGKSLGVQAKDFYAFATAATQKNGAIFGTLQNIRGGNVEIVSASGNIAERFELHTMSMNDGVMQMREVESYMVPAGKDFTLEPTGNHIMVMGLKKPLIVGDTLYIKISGANGAAIQVPVTVRAAGDVPDDISKVATEKKTGSSGAVGSTTAEKKSFWKRFFPWIF